MRVQVMKSHGIVLASLLAVFAMQARSAEPVASLPPAPSTISAMAQSEMNKFQQSAGGGPAAPQPGPDDIEGWRPLQEDFLKWVEPFSRPLLSRFKFSHVART